MHELNPFDAQRIDRRQDDRGIYVGLLREGGMTPPASDTVWPLTDADMRELRKPLPACRVPDNSVIGRVAGVLDRVPVRHFWIGYAACIAAAIGGLCLACR